MQKKERVHRIIPLHVGTVYMQDQSKIRIYLHYFYFLPTYAFLVEATKDVNKNTELQKNKR